MFNRNAKEIKCHWDIIAKINHPDGPNMASDIRCSAMYCNNESTSISRSLLIGNKANQKTNGMTGYVVYLPTDRLIKNVVKQVYHNKYVNPDNNNSRTLSQLQNEQNLEMHPHLIQTIDALSETMKDEAVHLIATALSNHLSKILPNKTVLEFIQRRANRDLFSAREWTGTGPRSSKKNSNTSSSRKKSMNKMDHYQLKEENQELEKYLMERKWGNTVSEEKLIIDDLKAWKKELQAEKYNNVLEDYDDVAIDQLLLEVDKALSQLDDMSHQPKDVSNRCINDKKMKYNINQYRLSRELGNFIQVSVDLDNKVTTCNCELYQYLGNCLHQKIFDMVEFKKKPSAYCKDTNGTSWTEIEMKWKHRLRASLFPVKQGGDNTKHVNFHTNFPTIHSS